MVVTLLLLAPIAIGGSAPTPRVGGRQAAPGTDPAGAARAQAHLRADRQQRVATSTGGAAATSWPSNTDGDHVSDALARTALAEPAGWHPVIISTPSGASAVADSASRTGITVQRPADIEGTELVTAAVRGADVARLAAVTGIRMIESDLPVTGGPAAALEKPATWENPWWLPGSATAQISLTIGVDVITPTAPSTLEYDQDTVLQAETLSGLPVTWSSTPGCRIIPLDGESIVVAATGIGSCTLTATTDGDGDWAPATVDVTVSLTRRTETLSEFLPQQLSYGDSVPLTGTAPSGRAMGWSATGACTVTAGTLRATSGVGTCTVTATIGGDDEWAPATVHTTLTLARGAETLAVSVPSRLSYGAGATLTATAPSGRTVVWTATGGCTVTARTVRATTGVGTCAVTASAAADERYTPASATRTITLGPAANTIAVARAGTAWKSGTVKLSAKRTLGVTATATSKMKVTVSARGACKLSGTTVRPTAAAGTCTLTFVAPADHRYARATTTRTLALTR
jgi:hypothetical protein